MAELALIAGGTAYEPAELPSAPAEDADAADPWASLLEARRAWQQAMANCQLACQARLLLPDVEAALAAMEQEALAAGLLLADALAGQADEAALLLLARLQAVVKAPAEPPVPAEPAAMDAVADDDNDTTLQLPIPQLPPPPKLPPVDVDAEKLRRIQEALTGANAAKPGDDVRVVQARALASLRDTLGGAPAELQARSGVLALLGHIEAALFKDKAWRDLSPADRPLLLEAVAARVRAIQAADLPAMHLRHADDAAERCNRAMRALRKLTDGTPMKRQAHGLAQKHLPAGASWLADARKIDAELAELAGVRDHQPAKINPDDEFRQLREKMAQLDAPALRQRTARLLDGGVGPADKRWVRLLEARLGDLGDDKQFRKLRRAVATALTEQDAETEESTATVIEPSWPGFAATAGKRAVIVGGDGRQDRVPLLQAAFRFAQLEWPTIPKNAPRATGTLVEKVRGGAYDIVIVLQKFISHSVTDSLFEIDVAGTTVVLARGYGVQQVRAGLERFLVSRSAGG